jgi:hypothetical protein
MTYIPASPERAGVAGIFDLPVKHHRRPGALAGELALEGLELELGKEAGQ